MFRFHLSTCWSCWSTSWSHLSICSPLTATSVNYYSILHICLFLFGLFLFTCFIFYFGHSVFVLSLFCSFLHMGEVMQYLSFSIWFIVLSIILLGPSMLQMARPHLLWLNSIPFVCMHIHHMFFIHSFVDRHLDSFHILAIVNKTVMDIGCIYLFKLLFLFSLDEYPEVE